MNSVEPSWAKVSWFLLGHAWMLAAFLLYLADLPVSSVIALTVGVVTLWVAAFKIS